MCEPGSRGADTGPDPLDRMLKLATLKDRIARDQYAVDPDVVAEALIRRVSAQRALAAPLSPRDARSRAGRAPRRPR
jgi:Anti-sigma-28 factor, FlgM